MYTSTDKSGDVAFDAVDKICRIIIENLLSSQAEQTDWYTIAKCWYH